MFYKEILKLAFINTGRLVVNTTVGILGTIDVAITKWVFQNMKKKIMVKL